MPTVAAAIRDPERAEADRIAALQTRPRAGLSANVTIHIG
jgi:hypothetical protein